MPLGNRYNGSVDSAALLDCPGSESAIARARDRRRAAWQNGRACGLHSPGRQLPAKACPHSSQNAYLREVRRRTRKYVRACWDNARRAVLFHDPESRLSYCDGKAFVAFKRGGTDGHTLSHGWLLLDGEAAEDLTLSATVAFFGVTFSREAVLDALDGAKSRDVPSLIDDWQRRSPLVRGKKQRRA